LLLNIQDYDDISRVQLLVAEVIEHDDELVDEWVELQILSEEQVEEAAEHRDRVDDAKQAADEAAEEARRAAADAADAAEVATDEQQRRAAVFDQAQDALQHLDRDRLEVESTIEALRAEIEAAEAAARAVVARAIERAAAAAGVAQQAIAAARAATRPDDAATTVPDGTDLDAPVTAPAPARSGGSLCGSSSGLAWPTSGCVNSGYGPRTAPTAGASSFHRGIDIAAPWGQPIHAVAAGVVWQASYSTGHGYVTVIDHGGGLFTLYAHQASLASVAVGDWVDAGQVIGSIGSTGISTGPHLHLEAHFGCAYACSKVDPAVLFR
ncbi:MAG TPA: M23 family metallopeptidase, partial [Nitriliruptoraceae bacterium]|nr:M23 family metallopeptidase [Nitriliruptoraceae bacterium]